ncbi:MAG: SDR family NAD(P)-dependent oxidoreductase [Balneola sp.]|nr:MAG: SDR family NAD(P)-dependent oxidoreductase [Balneola sp.]
MKKVIITGATSGIGRELAIQLSQKGYAVGLIGRREDRLVELKREIGDSAFIRPLDVTDFEKAEATYQSLIEEMGGLDIMILNAGVGRDHLKLNWDSDKQTIDVNVTAFAHGANVAFQYFVDQKRGQIVGMSSIASTLSSGRAAAYTASKHFISNYMTGFRQKANRWGLDIAITDIKPGYVESEMTAQNKNMFWVATTEKAVKQMVRAIESRKNHAYITRRWRLIAWVAKLTPQFIWDRLKF